MPKRHGTQLSGAQSAASNRRRPIGGAQTAAPKWVSPHKEGAEGGKYRTYATFHPVDKIEQNLVYRRKIEKYIYRTNTMLLNFLT